MAIPNLLSEVAAAQAKYPEAWRNAHTGNAQTEDFIRLLARDLRASHGDRWGLNGKRGNPNDISDDVIAYSGEGTAVDAVNGGPMEIIDVIAGAGGPNPQPVWNAGPGGPGDRGAFVASFSVPDGGPVTPPGPSAWTAAHSARLALLPPDTKVIAEDFAFAFPSESWGQKKADPSRPVSADVIARQLGGNLEGYKVVPKPSGQPQTFNLTGQVFVPVTPVNHAGGTVPPPVTPPPTQPPPSTCKFQPEPCRFQATDIGRLEAAIVLLADQVAQLTNAQQNANADAHTAAVAALEGKAATEDVRAALRNGLAIDAQGEGNAGWVGRISGKVSGVVKG